MAILMRMTNLVRCSEKWHHSQTREFYFIYSSFNLSINSDNVAIVLVNLSFQKNEKVHYSRVHVFSLLRNDVGSKLHDSILQQNIIIGPKKE